MNLRYVGKKVIVAIKERPFGNAPNIFSNLIPLFACGEKVDYRLDPNEFYNNGLIWWKLSYSMSEESAVPGMLLQVKLMEAKEQDRTNQNKSLYQTEIFDICAQLEPTCGCEVFTLSGKTERDIRKIGGDGADLQLPHLPSQVVYFRASGNIYGPFRTELIDREQCNPRLIRVRVKPVQPNRLYKINEAQFAKQYIVYKATAEISVDRTARYVNATPFSYEYIPPETLAKIEETQDSLWNLLDVESWASKLKRLTNGLKVLSRSKRSELSQLLDAVGDSCAKTENPERILELIGEIRQRTDDQENAVKQFVKTAIEEEYFDQAEINAARDAYLESWIKTQTEEINNKIEEKRRQLDKLQQEIDNREVQYQTRKNSIDVELSTYKAEEIAKVDKSLSEARRTIQQERDGWAAEKRKLSRELEEKGKKIDDSLRRLREQSETNAMSLIEVYPFLKGIVETKMPASVPHEKISDAAAKYEVPQILKDGSISASNGIDQRTFLRRLSDYASSKGLRYDFADLRRFHVSVLCEGVTVLAGPSGVGKSSLARLYGDLLSGEGAIEPRNGTHVIQVNPSWVERADLLGYVNTVSGEFTPSETGLFERLIGAQEDYRLNNLGSAVYPICLDEINLAQVEYYFNDFMQLLEVEAGRRELRCFSREATSKNAFYREYANIELSPSLRFIGTANFDETTKRLSSRLLDRVNLIEFNENFAHSSSISDKPFVMERGISYGTYASWIRQGARLTANVEQCLNNLKPWLQTLGTAISPRVLRAIQRYIATSEPLFDNASIAESTALDEQVAQRVLSKVRVIRSSEQAKALNEIEKILGDFCESEQGPSKRMIDKLRMQERFYGMDLGMEP